MPTEHPDQLARVIRRGRQIRRRQRAARVAAGLAAVLAVVGVVPQLAGDDGPAETVAAGRSTTTALLPEARRAPEPAAGASDGARDTDGDPTSAEGLSGRATGSGGGSGTPSGGATTGDSPDAMAGDGAGGGAAPASGGGCRNSHDPACGEFRWDPPPADNDPVTVSGSSPAVVRVGEEVDLRVVADDPDAVFSPPSSGSVCELDWGDDSPVSGCPQAQCPARYGPWTPPPEQAGHLDTSFTHVFEEPGEYRVSFTVRSGGFCDDPYASEGRDSVVITVVP